jgi:hypothetical protein
MSVQWESSIPGIGERAGFRLSKGRSLNGTVTKIEITRFAVWVTLYVSKKWGVSRRFWRVRVGSLMGWTVDKCEVRLYKKEEQ